MTEIRDSLNTERGSKNQSRCEMVGGMVGLDVVKFVDFGHVHS